MWKHRNDELADPQSMASLREHARLDALISTEYENPRSLATKDRRWFRRPKELIFTEPLLYKLQWIESVGLARARYARRHRNLHHLQAQRTAMRAYLIRTSRTTLPAPPS